MKETDCLGLPYPECNPPLVKDLSDIQALKNRKGRPISGAVLGKSLYAGTIKPAEALVAARRAAA